MAKKSDKKLGLLRTCKKKLTDLNPAEYNPRFISDESYAALKKSIEKFDYIDPIIWNQKTNRIVGGHQRLKALTELGYDEVEVVVVSLEEVQEKALNVTLNNEKVMGTWELDKLKIVLDELKVELPEFVDLRLDSLEMPSLKLETEISQTTGNEKENFTEYKADNQSIQIDDITEETSKLITQFLELNMIPYKVINS